MVSNSININKTSDHLSLQLIGNKTNTTHDVGNPCLGLEYEQQFGGFKDPNQPLLMATYPKTYRPLSPICTDDATLSLSMSTKIFSINKIIHQIYNIYITSFKVYSF